jgi:FimV-like protein
MVKRFCLLALLSLVCFNGVYAQNADALAEVDALREDGKFKEALDVLDGLKAQSPNDVEVLWRLARTRVDIGEQTEGDEQEALYEAALADAQSAVQANANHAEAQMALAIAAGRVGLISGTRRKIDLSRIVKDAVDRTIELDPNHPIAYHVRARWNYEVADLGFMERAVVKVVYGGLPKASFEQAALDFEKAIELNNNVINHLELGRTYMKLGEKDKARAALQKALDLPTVDPDDPMHKEEAQRLLRKL